MKVFPLFFVSAFYSSVAFSAPYELNVVTTPGYADMVSVESWDINDTRFNPMHVWSGTINPGLKMMIFTLYFTLLALVKALWILKRLLFQGPETQKPWGS